MLIVRIIALSFIYPFGSSSLLFSLVLSLTIMEFHRVLLRPRKRIRVFWTTRHGVSNLKTHYRFHRIMSSWQICQKLATWRRTVLSLYTSHATFPFTFPLFPSNSSTFSYLTSSHVPIQTETQFHQNKTTRRKSIDVNLMGHAVENRRVRRPGCSFGASRRLGASRLPGWVR